MRRSRTQLHRSYKPNAPDPTLPHYSQPWRKYSAACRVNGLFFTGNPEQIKFLVWHKNTRAIRLFPRRGAVNCMRIGRKCVYNLDNKRVRTANACMYVQDRESDERRLPLDLVRSRQHVTSSSSRRSNVATSIMRCCCSFQSTCTWDFRIHSSACWQRDVPRARPPDPDRASRAIVAGAGELFGASRSRRRWWRRRRWCLQPRFREEQPRWNCWRLSLGPSECTAEIDNRQSSTHKTVTSKWCHCNISMQHCDVMNRKILCTSDVTTT